MEIDHFIVVFLSLSSLLTQQSSGPLKLLVSHHHRSSNCSDLSLHSGSNLSSSLASSSQPLYDEILAPSGYRIGEPKSILIRKVSYTKLLFVGKKFYHVGEILSTFSP